jgi:segregation and condensation protein A
MLLPRPQLDEDGNEIDPREELVKHLLEYKKYKSVLQQLSDMESEMMQREKRGNIEKEIKRLSEHVNVESELQDVDLYKLLRVFQKVMVRFETTAATPTHQVVQYPYTIEQQKNFILERLGEKKKLSFIQVMQYDTQRLAVIYNFLAILELLQLQLITVTLGEGYNNFWIGTKEPMEENVTE